MATNPKKGKLLYHLTSISNLDSILTNGLLPREDCDEFEDIADEEIIQCREKHNLQKYTPFHFFGSTPFAGAVQNDHPEESFIYITFTRKDARHNNFKIILAHPLSLPKIKLYDYDEGMEKIDWELMAERDYGDENCKNACMAECITELEIPAELFHTIFVKNDEDKEKVIEICKEKYNGDKIPFYINVNKHFFVNND